jgi:hypothetical protein
MSIEKSLYERLGGYDAIAAARVFELWGYWCKIQAWKYRR